MNLKQFGKLLLTILICEFAGIIGSIFTIENIPTWYAGLAKPFFAPPNWVFGPVWITLYFLMGVALYLVWEHGFSKPKAAPVKKKTKKAIFIFAIQLALNTLWSYLFFGQKNPLAGLIGVILMWIAIAFTIRAFYKIDRRAGIVLLPYILWVSIALTLNLAVWLLNP